MLLTLLLDRNIQLAAEILQIEVEGTYTLEKRISYNCKKIGYTIVSYNCSARYKCKTMKVTIVVIYFLLFLLRYEKKYICLK